MVLKKNKKRKPKASTSQGENKKDTDSEIDERITPNEETKTEIREEDVQDDEDFIDPERKQHKSGVVYLSNIPPGFNVTKLKEEFNMYSKGCVRRPTKFAEKLLIPSDSDEADKKKKKRHLTYKEGWVEFSRKSVAKKLAGSLNGAEVQVRSKNLASGTMWLCKYLPGFKWIHLMEQLEYERKVNMQRMKVEVARAKKVAEHFSEQVEKGKNLKKLEEKVLKKGGLWERHQRQIEQRKPYVGKSGQKWKPATSATNEDELMKMIFAE